MILFGASLPSYKAKSKAKGGGKADDELINGDDPANRNKIRSIIDSLD
ncbi:MAG: hypothetical protein NC418_04390 [Muribaculaceae bacterium]|nr:hypothetical protein [Muribaculaceae bacterium]